MTPVASILDHTAEVNTSPPWGPRRCRTSLQTREHVEERVCPLNVGPRILFNAKGLLFPNNVHVPRSDLTSKLSMLYKAPDLLRQTNNAKSPDLQWALCTYNTQQMQNFPSSGTSCKLRLYDSDITRFIYWIGITIDTHYNWVLPPLPHTTNR